MALFWGKKDKKEDSGQNAREHERFVGGGEKARIYAVEYVLADLSIGGMGVQGYDDTLKAGQYFEFHLLLERNGNPIEFRGHAQVVRRKDDFLACKFTQPQPDLIFEVRDYLQSQ